MRIGTAPWRHCAEQQGNGLQLRGGQTETGHARLNLGKRGRGETTIERQCGRCSGWGPVWRSADLMHPRRPVRSRSVRWLPRGERLNARLVPYGPAVRSKMEFRKGERESCIN